MTIRELSNYYYISQDIETLEDLIKELEASIIKSPNLTGMPPSGKVSKPVEELTTKVIEKKEKLEKKKQNLLEERNKICDFIESIEDSLIRQIVIKRFLQLESWEQIGEEVYLSRTTSYKKLKRYLEDRNEKDSKDNLLSNTV